MVFEQTYLVCGSGFDWGEVEKEEGGGEKFKRGEGGGGVRVSKSCDRATVRPCKSFQRLRKIWVFERTNAQFTTVLPFLDHF